MQNQSKTVNLHDTIVDMMKACQIRELVITVLAGTFLIVACARKTYDTVYPALSDGKYDTEFPYRNCSEQLEKISQTVIRIYCMVDYKTFLVDPGGRLLPGDVSIEKLFEPTVETVKSNEACSGSGILIYRDNGRIALVTCAHLLTYPDTIYSYFNDNDPYTTDYLQAISLKTRQRIFFRAFPEGNNLEVLAMDPDRDLAIIGRETSETSPGLGIFSYPLGHSEELEWGSFVYVMGYPTGQQMITRGIVSRPSSQKEDTFLIDANFNEGYSGGAVLAVRDGVPNFELVGLGRSVSVNYENILVPGKSPYELKYNPNVPYQGEQYVKVSKEMNYGVTYAISTRSMREFFLDNRKHLEENGYYLEAFFMAGE